MRVTGLSFRLISMAAVLGSIVSSGAKICAASSLPDTSRRTPALLTITEMPPFPRLPPDARSFEGRRSDIRGDPVEGSVAIPPFGGMFLFRSPDALHEALASSAVAADRPVLRAHPSNPHYFEFHGQPTILVSSAEHYGAVINLDFDDRRYLETLARDGMNYTRVFAGSYVEGEQDIDWMKYDNTLAPRPGKLLAPWSRSDVAGYRDGGNKFDLDRWDDRYFARLGSFVRTASEKGIVVELTLFGNQYGDGQWAHSPMKASINA